MIRFVIPVHANNTAAGTLDTQKGGVFPAEGPSLVQLRESPGQSNGITQIQRLDIDIDERMRVFVAVSRRDSNVSVSSILIKTLHFRHNSAISHQQHLLLILPAVRQTEQIVRKFWIDVYRSGNINMKKLFVEMLESVSK